MGRHRIRPDVPHRVRHRDRLHPPAGAEHGRLPQLAWQTAAYRGERDAAIIQTLNDLAWLPFVGIVGTAIVQMVIIAVVVLQDDNPDPPSPRWSAYLNLWAALGVSAGSLVVFAKTGPVAWNGLIAWYLLCVSFFLWMVAMTWLMLRASHRREAATDPPDTTASTRPAAAPAQAAGG